MFNLKTVSGCLDFLSIHKNMEAVTDIIRSNELNKVDSTIRLCCEDILFANAKHTGFGEELSQSVREINSEHQNILPRVLQIVFQKRSAQVSPSPVTSAVVNQSAPNLVMDNLVLYQGDIYKMLPTSSNDKGELIPYLPQLKENKKETLLVDRKEVSFFKNLNIPTNLFPSNDIDGIKNYVSDIKMIIDRIGSSGSPYKLTRYSTSALDKLENLLKNEKVLAQDLLSLFRNIQAAIPANDF